MDDTTGDLLLHLTTPAEWRAALAAGAVAPPSLAEVGFVHLSTPAQVHLPADRLFAGRDDVVLLVVDPARLHAPVRFEPGVPLEQRATGARLTVPYRYNTIRYAYEEATNRWVRSVTGESPQRDVADGEIVAPTNVVVMWVPFRPLDDGQPEAGRLEADIEGQGRALVATNGRIYQATWRKTAFNAPTHLLDRNGRPIALSQGQTFVQVVPDGTDVSTRQGTAP